MQVGEPLHCIGQRLLVDLRVLRPNAVAQGAVGGGSEFDVNISTQYKILT
jgi:hypothetical protein